MTNKEIRISYIEYNGIDELKTDDQELVKAAVAATATAYAPYSKFHVGAAVRFEDGEIVQGSNQENAAYPSGICAERTTLFYASASRPGHCSMPRRRTRREACDPVRCLSSGDGTIPTQERHADAHPPCGGT